MGAGGGVSEPGESLYAEAGKLIRTDESLVALGSELFGDRVSLYTGALEFVQNDVSLPGNSALPVAVGRRHAAPVSLNPNIPGSTVGGHFGDWDLEIPHLHGVFAATQGWTVGNAPAGEQQKRCSRYGAPPVVGGQQGGTFNPDEYWQGNFLYVPGSGSQELLQRVAGPAPTDGASYPITTKDRWAIKCLTNLASGSGEGFVAIAPDGTQYRFDWMVSRPYANLVKSSAAPLMLTTSAALDGTEADPAPAVLAGGYFMRRQEVWILPTQVTDRHGNSVYYRYDPANPWRLTAIETTEAQGSVRRLSFGYADASYRIASVTDGSRTWNYSYRASGVGPVLSAVTLPDGSAWSFNMEGLTWGTDLTLAGGGACDAANVLNGAMPSGTMTHPSGATGTFRVAATSHGRSNVTMECRSTDGSPDTAYPVYPIYTDRFSIVSKTIDGPGLPTATWNYGYGPANASFAPCTNCATTKTVTVTDPVGAVTRYTFGNKFRETEGQLTLTEEGLDVGSGNAYRRTLRWYLTPPETRCPDPIGYSIQRRGNGELASRCTPERFKLTTQQQANFIWRGNDFDEFARPISISRWSEKAGVVYGAGEVYQALNNGTWFGGYRNDFGKWVLGLTERRVHESGVEMERREYDPAHLLPSRVVSFGLVSQSFTYNADGTVATRADGAGKTTQFFNYKRGLAQNVTYADGSAEGAGVNDLGQVVWVRNAAGTTTNYGYDAMGRLARIDYPTGDPVPYHATSIFYDQRGASEFGLAPGHWVQTTYTGQAVTERYFDAQWRPRLIRTYDNQDQANTRRVVVSRYDALGKKVFESYPQRADATVDDNLPGTSSSFDVLGRVVDRTQTGAGTTHTDYANNFQRWVRDPRGNTTVYEFQSFDEPREEPISRIFAPEGVTVTIARDSWSKPTSITREGGGKSVTRSYVYDVNQRLCKTIEPETGATAQSLDGAGNVLWRASGLSLPSGTSCDQSAVPESRKVNFSYDLRNRLTLTSPGDGSQTVRRSYTPDGLLQQIVASNPGNPITWNYTYNNRRLLTQEQYAWWPGAVGAGDGWIFNWGIDSYGHVASLADPSYVGWGTMTYAPNALGQATQVGSYVSGVSYHPNGAVAGYMLANGATRSVSQDVRGLPLLLRDSGPAGLVTQDRYSYDANGNVTAITDERDPGGSRSMTWYDGLDRLRQANGPWGTGTFDYDALDNLIASSVGGRSLTHSFDASNKLVGLSGSQNIGIAYDANGNVSSRGGQNFVFDITNRMTSAPGKANYYVYDGHGRRNLMWLVSGDYLHQAYTHDGKLRLAWRPSEGARRHIYLGDQLVAQHTSSGVTYQHTDALGSPVAQTDGSGAVVSRTRYEPYGATVAGTTNPTTIGFTGHVNDADTGLVYMQQRYYDPVAGRFLSVDPVVTDWDSGSSFNRYVYAHNNPYRYTDPDGRNPAVVAAAAAGCARSSACVTAVAATVAAAGQAISRGVAAIGRILNQADSGNGQQGGDKGAEVKSPEIKPSDVAGKTAGEIGQIAVGAGLVPKGSDPVRGEGSFIDPVTGKQRVLVHGDHAHVNDAEGKRLDVNGNRVPEKSPEAHLPVKPDPPKKAD